MTPNDAEAIEWDDENETHLARHGLDVRDVHSAISTTSFWVPNKKTETNRWKCLGQDRGGAFITIVVELNERRRTLRPITGWLSTAEERARFL
jgi:uncharacterized DUF497 family protein